RRRVNITHIEPTDKKIDIQKGASDEEVKKKLEESGLLEYIKEKIKIKIPTL
ncbi:MAG: 50S ribosomal protein L14e, partial [Saccharolobus sp.]